MPNKRFENKIIYQDNKIIILLLSRGYETIIDIDKYDTIKGLNWISRTQRNSDIVYAKHNYDSRNHVYLHRFLLNVYDPEKKVDHKNGNGLDNRISNLRLCSMSENLANKRMSYNNTLGYKGVTLHRKKYEARIQFKNKVYFLGSYDLPIDAAIAYNTAAKNIFGEFARLNDI